MKQIIFKITVMAVALLFVSCNWFRFPSGADSGYYVYITGEAGRSVDISYLQRDKGDSRKNTTVNETVTLPFSKEVWIVQFMNEKVPDCFLQINSKNDTSRNYTPNLATHYPVLLFTKLLQNIYWTIYRLTHFPA